MRELAERLAAVVGPEHVVADRRQLRLYRGGPWGPSYDTGRFGRTPALAVKPGDGGEVAACLAAVTAAGHPAIALGGATGVTGGALPTEDAVVLDLARLNTIFELDVDGRRARVGAAVRLGDLAAAAE